jgi:hypothetical protein
MAEGYLTGLQVSGYLPAAGGWVYFYQPGTTVQQTVYQDDAGSTVWTQPITLDQNGRPVNPVYAAQPVRAIFFSSSGAQLLDVARINGQRAEALAIANSSWPGETTIDGVLTALGTTLGGTDGNVKVTGSGAVQRTAKSKLSETQSVKDYGAVGNGIADDTAAITAAITAVNGAGGGTLTFPPGTYLVSSAINVLAGVSLKGAGSTYSIIQNTSGSGNCITATNQVRFFIEDLGISNSGTSTGVGILLTGCSYLTLSRLRVTGHRISVDTIDVNSSNISQYHRIWNCELITDGTSANGRCVRMDGVVNVNGSTGNHMVLGCQLSGSGGTAATLIEIKGLCSSISVVGNVSPPNNQTNGILINSAHTGSRLYFLGNDLSSATGAGLNIARATGAGIKEYANDWGPGVTNSSDSTGDVYGSAPSASTALHPTGAFGYTQSLTGSVSATITPSRGNVFEIIGNTGGATITVANMAGGAVAGNEYTFMCKNNSAGAMTFAFGTQYATSAAVTPAAGTRVNVTFRAPVTSTSTPSLYEVSRVTVTA